MRNKLCFQIIGALLMAGISLSVSMAGEGRGAKSRPGGGSSGSEGTSGSSRTTVSRPGGTTRYSNPVRVAGRSTYGRYRPYGYYGSYYNPYWWPYYGAYTGWYYWPHGYYPRYAVPTVYVPAIPEHTPAALEIDIKPGRAEVFLDGANIGRAKDYNGNWDVLWLDPGQYVLEYRKDGYKTLRTHIQAVSGRNYRFAYNLQKGEGLDPRSTSAPPVQDDKPVNAISVADGAVETAVVPVVQETAEKVIRRGLLRIRVSPADAAIYLDGEFLARAGELTRLHGALPVAEGGHLVEVVRPGYASRKVTIEVLAGEPAMVELELERE